MADSDDIPAGLFPLYCELTRVSKRAITDAS
jgi:hypothetical protein